MKLNKLNKIHRLACDTPLIKLEIEVNNEDFVIYAKHESGNFSGSIKDRMAFAILEDAISNNKLSAGDTIVEATSGNTGISFAAIGAYIGCKVKIFMPDWMSEERKSLIKLYGAELIEVTKGQGGFQGAVNMAKGLADQPGYFHPQQFDNPINIKVHQRNTAVELNYDMGKLGAAPRAFVAGAGTGGTIMGCSRYFKNRYGNSFIARPVFPKNHETRDHRIEGIGDSFIPSILKLDELDEEIRIDDNNAIAMAQLLNQKGLSVGISSGANIYAALVHACESGDHDGVTTVLPDSSLKYLSTDIVKDVDVNNNVIGNIKIKDYTII